MQPTDSSIAQPRAGYTLPVFACAAAIAALQKLHQDHTSLTSVSLEILEPAGQVELPIEQVACLTPNSALAITRSDPGDNLDLTRDTPIWALVERLTDGDWLDQPDHTTSSEIHLSPFILLKGGEGIGRQVQADNRPAIYAYARRLFLENLTRWLLPTERIRVTIILPEGRSLAERTSNAAFGVVEGLSLLGASGISQPLSAPGQLEAFRNELRQKAQQYECLVFCVGENGLHLAEQMGMQRDRLIKTANWLGPMLAEAGLQGVPSILLFGYHGKLIKLAGGVFHTHHHVADGRQEILTAHCANQGLPVADVQTILASATAEDALQHLRQMDQSTGSHWVEQIYGALAQQIDQRSADYIHAHSGQRVKVGSVLFGRDRKIIVQSNEGSTLVPLVC
ncbi:MAG TPA: cobalt-precorrin-5B (C(1))-methyltransferase CbiD [Crinalium sp.]|jgi:cobalt-precorrin-5B (C1)-methyltransferase